MSSFATMCLMPTNGSTSRAGMPGLRTGKTTLVEPLGVPSERTRLSSFSNPGTAGNLIDPVAAKLMQLFPQPNLATGDLHKNFFAGGTNQDSQDAFDIKIDHQFSSSKLLSAKFAKLRHSSHSFNCFPNE